MPFGWFVLGLGVGVFFCAVICLLLFIRWSRWFWNP